MYVYMYYIFLESYYLFYQSNCLYLELFPYIDRDITPMWVQGEAESHRTTFSYNSTVIGAHLEGNRIYLHVSETKHLENWNVRNLLLPELVLIPELVVNSTGLSATALANRFDGLHSGVVPSGYYARGCYFTLSNTRIRPFNHLIYPIPEDGGLGVHVTLDLDGQVRFGPDVEWIEGIDDISSFLNRYSFYILLFSIVLSLLHSILHAFPQLNDIVLARNGRKREECFSYTFNLKAVTALIEQHASHCTGEKIPGRSLLLASYVESSYQILEYFMYVAFSYVQ